MLRLTAATIVSLVCATAQCFLLTTEPHGGTSLPSLADPPLRIGSFNIQVFGTSKFSDPHVVDTLVKILSRYDVVQILEIRDSTDTVFEKLRTALNHYVHPGGSDTYQKVVSARLGRTNSKEQYGFLYKSAKVHVAATYQVPDSHDVFEREPFTVRFTSPTTCILDYEFSVIMVSDFVLAAIHIQPDKAAEEMDNLTHVYDLLHTHYHTNNIILGGDFNADCSYLAQKSWKNISLRTDTRFEWLIHDNVDTTVSVSACSYDRFVISGRELSEGIVPGSVHAYRFDEVMGLPKADGLKVSDHYPVEFQLKGKPHEAVQRSIHTSISFSVKDVQPVSDVNNIREIYHEPSCATGNYTIKLLKEDTHMDYVEAKYTAEDPRQLAQALFEFRHNCNGTISDELLAMLNGYLDSKFLSNTQPIVYGLVYSLKKLVFEMVIKCSLIDPYVCEVSVSRNVS